MLKITQRHFIILPFISSVPHDNRFHHGEIINPLAFPLPLFSAILAMNSVPPSVNVSFHRKPWCFVCVE